MKEHERTGGRRRISCSRRPPIVGKDFTTRSPRAQHEVSSRLFLFTRNAERAVRQRLESLGTDRLSAPSAESVGAVIDLPQRALDVPELPAQAIDQREHLAALGGALCAVGEAEVEVARFERVFVGIRAELAQ